MSSWTEVNQNEKTTTHVLTNHVVIDLTHGNKPDDHCKHEEVDLEAYIQLHIEQELQVEAENQRHIEEEMMIEVENLHCVQEEEELQHVFQAECKHEEL